MNLSKLGYTEKWIEFGFLNEENFAIQLNEFETGKDKNAEQFRYTSFINWLANKKELTKEEIANYIELVEDDEEKMMAGKALKELFSSPIISDEQFEVVKFRLVKFGEWTKKLIQREVLKKRLEKETLTIELFDECLSYKKEFQDNRLLVSIINQTDDTKILEKFTAKGIGKQIKTLAEKKLNKIKRKTKVG